MPRKTRLNRIAEIVTKAHESGRAVPTIVLPCKASPTGEIRLHRATEKSRFPGDVQVTDGRRDGNTWFGAINHRTGNMFVARETPAAITALLVEFNDDPAGVGARLGLSVGSCVFCNRALTTDESKGAGYGPKCAERFDLPWGKATAVADVAEDYVTTVIRPRRLLAERIVEELLLEDGHMRPWETAVDAVERILAGE